MKNKIFYLLIFVLFITSCITTNIGKILYFNDEYKNREIILLSENMKITDNWKVPVISTNCTFTREKTTNSDMFYIETLIRRTVSSNDISEDVFINIDNQKYQLKYSEKEITNRNEIQKHETTTKEGDSTNVKITTSTNLTYSSYVEEKIKFEISEEIVEKLKNAQSISLRFYSEPYPVDLEFKDKTINKIHQILK